jgi:ABC-type multidrug transport system fused ATPase/permease subunit
MWLLGRQKGLVLTSAALIFVWFLPGSLNPYILGRVVDAGITAHDWDATWKWTAVLVAVIVFGVACNVASSLVSVAGWLVSMFRITKLVIRKVAQMSHVIVRRVPAGEMLSVANSDADTFGALAEVFGRLIAAVASFGLVAALVLREDVQLGLLVLIGTPLVVLIATPLLRPAQRAQLVERERSSKLTGMAVDIVQGLRILRGIGGERTFGDNYARQSQSVRQAGVRTGTWWATQDATSVITTGLLLVVLTWFGVTELMAGDITVGQLVGFFGYAIFLQRPVQAFFDTFQKWTAALVSAHKTIGLLSHAPPWRPAQGAQADQGEIVDEASGFVANPGELTIIVSAVPDESAGLADRIGRYLPADMETLELGVSQELSGAQEKQEWVKRAEARARQVAKDEEGTAGAWGVTLDGVDLAELTLEEVRSRVVVSDASSQVYAGTLQSLVDPHTRHTREEAEQALWVASAEDVWDAFADGWQGRIDERGRGLSGGQRQRLVLTRVLLMDPEVLVLVEPTSAVDAHTEARVAERLPDFRQGRTTILTTVSPLWLRHADKVVLLKRGLVVAEGTHRTLMETSPAYRNVVVRDEDTAAANAGRDSVVATPRELPDISEDTAMGVRRG